MRTVLLILLYLSLSSTYGSKTKYPVLRLTTETFEQAINKFDYTLILVNGPYKDGEFSLYYENMAQSLAKTYPNLQFARFDCTFNDIPKKYGDIREMWGPTFLLFNKGSENPIKYTGGKTYSQLLNWIKKNMEPMVKEINTIEEAEEAINNTDLLGFFFGEINYENILNNQKTAETFQDVIFVHTNNEEIKKKYGVDVQTLILFKKSSENKHVLRGSFNTEDMVDFVNYSKKVGIIPFTEEIARHYDYNSPQTPNTIFLIKDENEAGALAEKAFRQAAKNYGNKINFCVVSLKDLKSLGHGNYLFSADKQDLPAIRILYKRSEEDPLKWGSIYHFEEDLEITTENIKNFVDNVVNEKLAYYRTEPIPSDPYKDGVRIVVAKNFHDIVLNEDKNVLMYYGGSNTLIPSFYSSLVELYKGVEDFVIGVMDMRENKLKGIEIESIWAVQLYLKGEKESPVKFSYEMERTQSNLINFLRDNGIVVSNKEEGKSSGEMKSYNEPKSIDNDL